MTEVANQPAGESQADKPELQILPAYAQFFKEPRIVVSRNDVSLTFDRRLIERGPTRGTPYYGYTPTVESLSDFITFCGAEDFLAMVSAGFNKKCYNWTDQAVEESDEIKDTAGNVTSKAEVIGYDAVKNIQFIQEFSATSESKADLENKRDKMMAEMGPLHTSYKALLDTSTNDPSEANQVTTKAALDKLLTHMKRMESVVSALNKKKRTRRPIAEEAAV